MLIYYRPPAEFKELYPGQKDRIWRAKTQFYGDVEAELYWNRTFVSWLTKNILDVKQSIYDPSLLYSPSTTTAILIRAGDTANIMAEEDCMVEESATRTFKCTDRQFPRTDFKGIDVIQDGTRLLSRSQHTQKG